MNSSDNIELLLLYSKIGKPFELTVSGSSMNPVLHDRDTITVRRKDAYEAGDILVFLYKYNELLVHRLLKIQNGRYFCKGDNSFRLEDIEKDKIIGAVVLEDDRNHNSDFIAASLAVSKVFRRCRYDADMTKASPEYEAYKRKYLEDDDEVQEER